MPADIGSGRELRGLAGPSVLLLEDLQYKLLLSVFVVDACSKSYIKCKFVKHMKDVDDLLLILVSCWHMSYFQDKFQ